VLLAAAFGAAAFAVAGCSDPPHARKGAAAAQDGGYLAPPAPDTVRLDASGVVLSGHAPAGARVRLAQPDGQAVFAAVDAQGRWTLLLGPSPDPRIFGLSATADGHTAQAEGYVVVTPRGQAALLRAGGASVRIDSVAGPGLRSVDFDAGGGLQVACAAPPRTTILLRLDGRQVAEGRADEAGRYVVSLPTAGQPAIRPGPHLVEMGGDGFSDSAGFTLSPAPPLATGPLRSQLTPAGLRLDWMTPGGGVQSTLLPD
jgi:hypothetical protein